MKHKSSAHYSFYLTLPHLQITFSCAEYEELQRKYGADIHHTSHDPEYHARYLDRLPEYMIARCPICGSSYRSKLDLHSLGPNVEHNDTDYLFRADCQQIDCTHFVGVTFFINLNGALPIEYAHWGSERGDVPVIVPTLLSDEFEAFSVIHSLPICRIENGIFVPKYSMYILTYYAKDPMSVRNQRYTELQTIIKRNKDSDPLPFLSGSESAIYNSIASDLQHWAKKDRLYWLDLHTRALPLQQGSVANFPYTNILGYGKRYVYRRDLRFPWDKLFHKEGRIYC